jgi:hypothetical protein
LREGEKRGYITGDDYDNYGLWEGGVKKAVDEYVPRGSVEVIQTTNGQFALIKK